MGEGGTFNVPHLVVGLAGVPELTLLPPKKMVFSGGLSVVTELGP